MADVVELLVSSRIELNDGTLDDDVLLFDQAQIVMTGGEIGGELALRNSSRALIESGEVGELTIVNNAMARVVDGEVGEVGITGASEPFETGFVARLDIEGGEFGPIVVFSPDENFTDAILQITGGTFSEGVEVSGPGAVGTMSGVEVETFDMGPELVAKNFGDLTIDGGTGEEVQAVATFLGTLTINELSSIALSVDAISGNALINGGDAASLDITADRGNVFWRGGDYTTADIEAKLFGLVEVFGSAFQVNGQPFLGGDVLDASGEISGILADGTPFYTTFLRDPTSRIVLTVPEPNSIAMALLAVLAIAGRSYCRREATGPS